jgi:dipeptidyl aminopeptidase/acylaminoacyl peptidase
MLKINSPRCRLVLLVLLCCMGVVVHAQTQTPPTLPSIKSFFANSEFSSPLLSPSARYLAVRSSSAGGHNVLLVIDLVNNSGKVVASYNNVDIGDFQWVSDERLIYNVRNNHEAQGDIRFGPGLYAINRDGSYGTQLADRRGESFVVEASYARKKLLPWHTFMLKQEGARDSEFIYVRSPEYYDNGEVRRVDLLRLNTLSGAAQSVPRPGPVHSWLLDQKGEPRIAIGTERGTTTIFYRDPTTDKWRQLARYSDNTGEANGFEPLGFGPDGTLYVAANAGEDTRTLRTFDFATGKVSKEALVVTTGFDFVGALISNRSKMLGVRFQTDAVENEWFDPGMKTVQQAVNKLRPGTINLIAVADRAEVPWVLVESYSDQAPRRYTLYNTETGRLNEVGMTFPAIDSTRMAHQEPVRYKARDGLEIPALLTIPAGSSRKNLPLVVLVHGGPWVRGATWGWEPESQFLASRGYAVLEPEFRGSRGFGTKHFVAGWKQWGLAMQNDIADGARWVMAQGIADPARICIAGASYGGYATLMGLINDPDLYKCGIDWVGVTDINLMYDGHWSFSSDLPDEWKRYGMPELVGDQVKDGAQLKATSPLEQAARIKQPVLLAYGGADRRVPLYHGKKFYDAVKHTNPNVEWIEYPEEGHGWWLAKTRIDFWSRVEKFLSKNIGRP